VLHVLLLLEVWVIHDGNLSVLGFVFATGVMMNMRFGRTRPLVDSAHYQLRDLSAIQLMRWAICSSGSINGLAHLPGR
jgi:hypothetical protein